MTHTTVKLQKYLSQAGVASRRQAEIMIEQGKVKVNDEVASIGQRIDPDQDKVQVNDKPIQNTGEHVYFLINKPPGLISTTSDELHRANVLSLIPPQKTKIYPVGRLDRDSAGLMLLTNDGALTNYLTHPKYEVKKVYHVRLDRTPTPLALEHLQKGVKLSDGWAKPIELKALDHDHDQVWFEITIGEGRNRLIRRMWERVGYNVIELIRVALGPFHLDQLKGQKYLQVENTFNI